MDARTRVARLPPGAAAVPGLTAEGPLHQAPFITKLFEIVEKPSTNDSIRWGDAGETVVVCDPSKLAQDVMPQYFKHDNIRSFLRQLNIYGFQRCRESSELGKGQLEFYHEKFAKGRRDLVRQITRGIPSQKRTLTGEDGPLQSEELSVAQMRYVVSEALEQINRMDEEVKLQRLHMQGQVAHLLSAVGDGAQGNAAGAAAAEAPVMAKAQELARKRRAAGAQDAR